jgi:hypothetical protein
LNARTLSENRFGLCKWARVLKARFRAPSPARHFATETGVSYRAHRRRSATTLPGFHPTPSLIGYRFFFGWAGVCFGCSGAGVGLCSRTIFPSQEMYAPMISSRRFFRFNSISAILCSKVLCSSGIGWFLSELLYCREVDSLLAKISCREDTARAPLGMIAHGDRRPV